MTMWTLLLLCSVIISHGVQGQFSTMVTMRETTAMGELTNTEDMSYGTTNDMMTETMASTYPTTVPSCGGNLNGSAGQFYSPGYPGPYPNNVDCVWHIYTGPVRQIIELQFPYVSVEGDFSCRYDSISVFDGSSVHSRLLDRLCGAQNSTFYSTSQYLTVRFKTDESSNYNGFRAEYHTVAGGSCRFNCGYHVGNCSCAIGCEYMNDCCSDYETYGCADRTTTTAPTARPTTEATSEEYVSCRNNCGHQFAVCSCDSSCQNRGSCCYDYNAYCQVSSTMLPTPPGTAYSTEPVDQTCQYNCGYHVGGCSCSIGCEYRNDCCSDYETYCQVNTTPPPRPVTTESFTTGVSCGGSLHGSGSFSSPYYPNYYHDNAQCVWHLMAPVGQRVFLSITDLQMENCCACDYINIYGGPTLGRDFLGTVCSNSTKNTFISSSNHMTVYFKSDSSVVGRGFEADFTSTLSTGTGCASFGEDTHSRGTKALAPTGSVDCSSDNMNIVIARSYLDSLGYDGHNLYLNDQYCRPRVTNHQVVFSFPINTCGTRKTFENDRVVYSNAVRAYASRSGEITRQSHFKLNVTCRMEQDTMVQIMYKVREEDNSSIAGSGRFNATMAFYTSSNFYYQVTQVPYLVVLNQPMYVQVNLRRDDSSLVLFLDTCVASPSPHDFSSRYYTLISNGCPKDGTYQTHSSGLVSKAQFSFRAFQFLRAHESVYLQCKILICQAADKNSRCTKGCQTRKARDLGSDSAHESHVILGPIRLRDPKKQD